MKIAIIGAGAVGVTTAHALSLAGSDVHVFEQGSSAAQGASFAHSGVLGALSVQPFFGEHFTRFWFQSFFRKPHTLHWSGFTRLTDYAFVLKAAWLSHKKIRLNTQAQLNSLAQYSETVFNAFVAHDGMAYEQGRGLLALHTHANSFELASQQAFALNAQIALEEHKIKVLSAEQARVQEPSLSSHTQLLGAVYFPDETYGNCALFTKQLKLLHQDSGVQYHFSRPVNRLERVGKQWRIHANAKHNSVTGRGSASGSASLENVSNELYDSVVIAAGVGSNALLAPLGVKLPILELQAYCVAFPIKEPIDAPRSCVLDVARGSYITPIGQRIRISGQYHLADKVKANGKGYKRLGHALQQWYPFASKASEASYETSATCIAIDSKPIIGETHLPGLFVNFAHGPQHWALSFGSAKALADTIVNKSAEFDLTPFLPQRFSAKNP
jgi:D-amino-acid dehydrogenase